MSPVPTPEQSPVPTESEVVPPPVPDIGNDNKQDGGTPEPSGANVGVIAGAAAAGVALLALAVLAVIFKRRRSKATAAESQPAEPDLDTFQTGQFEGEDEIAGDYTNPVYDGKGSDDQFEDDIGELV
jgi:hypothetical protein